MTSDSPAAGKAASAEAERAWQAWYQPEHDIARFMATSPYDKMREAFAAGFAAADPERARLRGFESGAKAEREGIARLAEDEAERGAKSGLDRIALRAFAQRLRGEAQ